MKAVVFAWGNPSRGDDSVGPWFANWLRQAEDLDADLIEDFQLQVEHLLDFQAGDILLFIDACSDAQQDFYFEEVTATDRVTHTSHALAPEELLGYYRRLFDTDPPPAFQLTVAGKSFELGEAMSAATAASCRRATELVETLLRAPDPANWRTHTSSTLESCNA